MVNKTVGIREAKAHLSQLLREVRKGCQIVITDRGRPVARLLPPLNKPTTLTQRIQKLVDEGLIQRPSNRSKGLPPPIKIPMGLAQEYLQADRDR